MTELHRSVVEAASWRLGAELARRHPQELMLIRTHPGGGQYDCLTLVATTRDPDEAVAVYQLNRIGTIQVHHTLEGEPVSEPPTFSWVDYLSSEPYGFVRRLEDFARLPQPLSVPVATPPTVTLRLLAAIAATGLMGVHPVEILSGYVDTSGYGGGPRDDLFAAFPAIEQTRRRRLAPDFLGVPEYRFWFVTVDEEPVAAFETTGQCWHSTGEQVDVMQLYEAHGRRLWPVVADVCGRHLR